METACLAAADLFHAFSLPSFPGFTLEEFSWTFDAAVEGVWLGESAYTAHEAGRAPGPGLQAPRPPFPSAIKGFADKSFVQHRVASAPADLPTGIP